MKTDLQKLLRNFNEKGYSDPNSKYVDNGKDGKVLKLEIGEYSYEDEYYGGEPYSGNETIWKNGVPIFRCVYWGKVDKDSSFKEIYAFLRKALAFGPSGNCAHRGPAVYSEGNFTYKNKFTGTMEEFTLTESIFKNGREVYVATFLGGLVNQQNE